MKRVLGLVVATLMAFALTSATVASADSVDAAAAPTPKATVDWTGNGTTNGFCDQIFNDPNGNPGEQVWLFILTSPSGSSWDLSGVFADSGPFGPIAGDQQGKGAIHFFVTTSIDDHLLSATATNGSTNSVLTVSHCTTGEEGPPPPGTGSLLVKKSALGDLGQAPKTVTVHVECNDAAHTTADIDLAGTGQTSDPIEGIEEGTKCTVEETTVIPGVVPSYDPVNPDKSTQGLAVIGDGVPVTVTVTNNYPSVGSEVVTPSTTPVVVEAAVAVAATPAFTG